MKHADVVIVGGGTTGSVLAARLSEDPERSVLLLEAGHDYPTGTDGMPDQVRTEEVRMLDGEYMWFYPGTLGDRIGRDTLVFRGRVVGGSGQVNGCVFHRGMPEDYDSWGSELWTYQAVLPYFRRYESDEDFGGGPQHGSDGPVPVRRFRREQWPASQCALYDAAVALGYAEKPDMSDPEGEGIGPMPRNSADDLRMSAAVTHLLPARARDNLEVRGDTQVTRVLFDGTRAIGVEVVDGDGRAVIEADEVVLTAGAIGTPHLLMLSGVGPAAALAGHDIEVVADLPGVGQNLRDHPSLTVPVAGAVDTEDPRQHVLLSYTAAGSSMRNDMNVFMGAAVLRDPEGNEIRPLLLIAAIELAQSSGEVQLRSADPLELPFVNYRYLENDLDRARMREAAQLLARLLDSEQFADVGLGRMLPPDDALVSDEALDAWVDANLQTFFHSCGTCRMGAADDPGAVVDDRGRVHGLQGLRIADLSIAPDAPRAATNATAFMIGERMADLVRGA